MAASTVYTSIFWNGEVSIVTFCRILVPKLGQFAEQTILCFLGKYLCKIIVHLLCECFWGVHQFE
jgi:hypothetical protein